MYIYIHSMCYFDVISPTTTVIWLLSVFGYTGTLEPSAFSVERKPRRDLSTIIHILNDLLNAVPHYKPHSFLHPPQRSSSDHKYTGRLRQQQLLTPPPNIYYSYLSLVVVCSQEVTRIDILNQHECICS